MQPTRFSLQKARRSSARLMLEYRDIGFTGPTPTPELLPDDRVGLETVALCGEYSDLLTESANRFFDGVFKGPPPST